MKKLNVILLIFSFVLSGLGGLFLFGATASNQSIVQKHASIIEESTEYTYKTYEDYFTDLDFTKSNITGTGSQTDPYQIHSTEEFLHLLAGNGKYLKKPKHNLPSEYTEVRYLRSTGTQYIDTGVALKQSITVQASFMTNDPSGEVQAIFGAVDKANNISISAVTTGMKFYATHGITDGAPSIAINSGIEYEFEFKSEGRWYVNDELMTNAYEIASTGESNLTMWLFARQYDNGTIQLNQRHLSIYEFKFYDNGELIRHYIPCYRNADMKPGMFDLVTGEFLINAGAGEFEYGNYNNEANMKNILNGKYIELHSDIILNDETFDENGNPSGGDGIVYKWNGIKYPMYIDGNGYSISGLYINDDTLEYVGLFYGYIVIKSVQNINFDNVYIKAARGASPIGGRTCETCKNVTSSGFINCRTEAGGVARVTIDMENCINRVKVTSSGHDNPHIGGLIFGLSGVMKNCQNYGEIVGEGSYVGGIVALCTAGTKISKCTNYADIKGKYHIGGILGAGESNIQEISGCKNFGDVISSGTWGIGGIVGYLTGKMVLVSHCENYGDVKSIISSASNISLAGICGYINSNLTLEACKNFGTCDTLILKGWYNGRADLLGDNWGAGKNIRVQNCEVKSKSPCPAVIGCLNLQSTLFVDNLRVENDVAQYLLLFYSHTESANNVVFNNIYIKSKASNLTLFYSMENKLTLKNIYINTSATKVSLTRKKDVNLDADGIIVDSPNSKLYYGSNFSGFYFSWRTGIIGLISLDGRGQFQGKIDEELLKAKGFIRNNT